MSRSPGRAFSLLEATLAVAMLSLVAGLMAPLALKTLNQGRAASTRHGLRRAFEAMFGARDRRVANMRADFGFDPADSFKTLPFLVSRSWGEVPAFGPNDGASFHWGYNGPYWLGPVVAGNPVDAWGSPIQLLHDRTRGTWQLRSLGPDKAESADDLYYPATPAAVNSFRAAVLVVITRASRDIAGTVTLRYGGDTGSRLAASTPEPIRGQADRQSLRFWPPAGAMELVFRPREGGFEPFTLPMDLLPGQTREVEVRL
jgi:hypothetical protein